MSAIVAPLRRVAQSITDFLQLLLVLLGYLHEFTGFVRLLLLLREQLLLVVSQQHQTMLVVNWDHSKGFQLATLGIRLAQVHHHLATFLRLDRGDDTQGQ